VIEELLEIQAGARYDWFRTDYARFRQVGKNNSSKTKVQPFFRQLLDRDPRGSSWLTKLLARGQNDQALSSDLSSDPGLLHPTYLDEERKLSPPSRQRQYQLKNEAAGLCSKCGRVAVEGKKMCQKHIEYHRQRARLAKGLQPKPGLDPASRATTRCYPMKSPEIEKLLRSHGTDPDTDSILFWLKEIAMQLAKLNEKNSL
jgi:hypothetical protein